MKKYLPHFAFTAIVLAVMLPLYQSGFVFLLDMIFTPNLDLGNYLKGESLSASLPITILIKLFSFILPLEIIQKIILSLVLFLPGFFMYKLAKLFLPMKWAVLSGVFFMLNPYVYERFLAGHWYVLLGYAFFPLLVKFFLEFLEKSNNKNFLKFALLFSVFPILSLHWAYISFWFLILLGIVYFAVRNKNSVFVIPAKAGIQDSTMFDDKHLEGASHYRIVFQTFIKYIACSIILFLTINSFWLVGFLSSSGAYYKFSLNDFKAFATQSDPTFGVFFNVLSLYGFWNVDYFSAKDFFQFWWIPTLIILFFTGYGIYKLCLGRYEPSLVPKIDASEDSRRPMAQILCLTLTIAFIPIVLLSVGYGSEITKPIINFLYEFLPGFKGLRETEKLVGLLAFSYAILFSTGGFFFAKKLKYVFPLFLLIPFLVAWPMLWGFSGQVKTSDYPKSWYQANETLKQDENNKLLFLPWHGYPRLSFAGYRRIANPAPRFFQAETVFGKNIDNAYLLECDQGIWDKKMFQLLQGFETLDENIDFLRSQGITHILLAKEADYERYGFLKKSKQLEKVLETDDVVLWKVGE